MSRPSKKHHFVPQAQLRHFAADSDKRFLFVFDKQTDHSFRTSILNAGSENDFNTVSLGESRWNFEDLFHDVDFRSALLVANILSHQSLAWLTVDDRLALADFFATQMLRTHFSRTTPVYVVSRLRETVRQFGYDPDEDPSMAIPSDAATRLSSVKTFLDRSEHLASLLRLYPALYRTSDTDPFLISDHPVATANAFPYGDRGINSHGILVFLPISPEFSIALHCPTIVKRYELAQSASLVDGRMERILRYRDGLRSGDPINIDSDTALYLNHQQIAQSTRYLYAAANSFDGAREFLKQKPDLRSVTTNIFIGEMGGPLPQRPQMPVGTHLVVHGPFDHGMLEILEIDERGEDLTARTSQIALLGQMATDAGPLRVELYIDGHCRRIGAGDDRADGKPSRRLVSSGSPRCRLEGAGRAA